jgi:hypothetical protein
MTPQLKRLIVLRGKPRPSDLSRSKFARQRDELLAAAEAIEINAEECTDFDDSTAMLIPMDDYHKLMEAIASAKGGV